MTNHNRFDTVSIFNYQFIFKHYHPVGRRAKRGCCQTPFKKRADMHLLGSMGTQKQAISKLKKEIAGGF